jgi:hypothetical protein
MTPKSFPSTVTNVEGDADCKAHAHLCLQAGALSQRRPEVGRISNKNEMAIPIRKTVALTFVSALFSAIAFVFLDFTRGFSQNALSGAIVGAVSGLVMCAALCVLEPQLMPQANVRHSKTGTVSNAIIGGFVGLIVTSVLVTIAFTIVGQINHLPDPFLWGALISALAGWALGALIGAMIGASWEQMRL